MVSFLQWVTENICLEGRFDEINRYLQLSDTNDPDVKVMDFLHQVNLCLQEAIMPGDVVTIDKSMIKSYHKNLKGKIKIIRKLRPVSNEIKDVSDAR